MSKNQALSCILFVNVIVVFTWYKHRLYSSESTSNAAGSWQRLSAIKTTDESLRCMYGEGNGNYEYDEYLLEYIRSLTSRPSSRKLNLTKLSATGHYSQYGGSERVDELLKRRRNGFFVEVGAYRGEALSDSLFFELKRNWTGLLIEANPIYHREILQKNRNALVLRACLSTGRKAQLMKFKIAGWGSGITSVNRNYKTKAASETDVQCFSLNSILAAIGVRHIDFMVLDVEGAELPVLHTIDWRKITIDLFSIEYLQVNRADSMTKLNQLRAFFKKTAKYREAGTLPLRSSNKYAQDVIFMRR